VNELLFPGFGCQQLYGLALGICHPSRLKACDMPGFRHLFLTGMSLRQMPSPRQMPCLFVGHLTTPEGI
jgi:hypothetical protein